mmetsp:Transcript_28579/g.51799  ORF Transcript_28579/g.51799 Transcript_28579/m.51799 type:complete len:588 (-) Transcript_28579:294-2057(-)
MQLGSFLSLLALRATSRRQGSFESLAVEAESNGRAWDSCNILFQSFDRAVPADQCLQCVSDRHCQWCPATQECISRRGILLGKSCPAHGGAQAPITESTGCSSRPPWAEILDEAHGAEWHSTDEGYESNLDAVRCTQWYMGKEVTPDEMSLKASDHDAGHWGCVSALLREGILGMLAKKALPSGPEPAASKLRWDVPDWYWDAKTWSPSLCQLRNLSPAHGKEKCYVRAWKAEQFEQLMRLPDFAGVEDRLLGAVEKGPIKALKPSTGKSGSSFGALGDGEFIVKLDLWRGVIINEPDNLMKLMSPQDGIESLSTHYSAGHSLINKPLSLMKLNFGGYSTHVTVIEDGFYGLARFAGAERDAGRYGEFVKYDLKGASRKAGAKNPPGREGINGNFDENEHGQILLRDEQCIKIRNAVTYDANFLTEHNMVDYSLLLLPLKKTENISCSRAQMPEPWCLEHGDRLYTLSIIDYLNDRNFLVSLRGEKFVNYDKKMIWYMSSICPTQAEKVMKAELRKLIGTYYSDSQQAFIDMDVDYNGFVDIAELRKFLRGSVEDQRLVEFIDTMHLLTDEKKSEEIPVSLLKQFLK